MRVLSIVHQADAGSGTFGQVARERGDDVVEWRPPEGEPPALDGVDPVLTFGGGMHLDQEAGHPWLVAEKALLREALAHRTPVLGVCLGSQLVAEAGGGGAHLAALPEIGWKPVELLPAAADDPLAGALPACFDSFQWHSYHVDLPPGAVPLAQSADCLQAFRLAGAPAWGIQFHAEVTRATVEDWLRDYSQDDDARAVNLDPDAVRAQTERAIGPWIELGRGLAARFLEAATPA